MELIAIFKNEQGDTTNFTEKGELVLVEKQGGTWVENSVTSVELKGVEGNPRIYLEEMVSSLKPCKIIICDRLLGIAYQLFEREGFTIWEIEGNLSCGSDKFFDEIYKESNEVVEEKTEEYVIDDMGNLIIDLRTILELDSSMTSKKVVHPLLKKPLLKKLTVICSHIPPWLQKTESISGFNIDIKEQECVEQKVILERM